MKALITRTRKSLPRGKKGEAERTLLKNCYHFLVHASWHDLANKPEARAGVMALLERFPEWREPFWVVKHFLYLHEASDLATAMERLAAWNERLTPNMRAFFKDALNYIGDDWEAFLVYFSIKERTGLSVTSGPVESRHSKKNGYWYNARASGPELLKAKSAADAGIAIQLERQELERLWKQDRERKKRQREDRLKKLAAMQGDELASPPLAA